jgi:hypothetical protein
MPEELEVNQFALAGVGAVVGGIVGAVIGVFVDRSKKKANAAENTSAPNDGTIVGN